MLPENYVIDRIKELCEKKRLTQYKLSQKSGVAQSSLSTMYKRESTPNIYTIDKICNGLGITLSQFFAEDNEYPNLTDEQKELLDVWSQLDDHKKELAKAYIQGMIEK